MKKYLIMAALLNGFAIASFATIHVISVANYQFSPKTINAHVNDTIVWIWKNGSHTTTSTQIPQGAMPWDSPITQTKKRFGMIVTVPGIYKYKCKPHASSGMTGTINVSAAKPADGMYGFSLLQETDNTHLKWLSDYNADIAYYKIKRSLDGSEFNEIAKIAATGNAYSYTDKTHVKSRFVYYMIEAIYKDGSIQYSDIKMNVRKTSPALITNISPNPVTSPGHLMLTFNADKDGQLLVQLLNASGVVVKQVSMQAVAGVNSGHLHLGNLKPGTYYLQCAIGKQSEKHTVIFQ